MLCSVSGSGEDGCGTITEQGGGEEVCGACAETSLGCIWGSADNVQEAPGKGEDRRRKDGTWPRVMSQALCFPRLGCGVPPCSPMPQLPEECRRLRTCSECLARHPRTLQPGDGEASAPRCKWCTNCPEGACIGRNGSCTSENDCRINQREVFWAGNCSEAVCGAADCEQCTREGKCMWTRQFKRTGETRRILSVQPTYDWTCFSHSLLNVSPMPVESSPPLPCPTPCHLLPNCTSCLDSKGADGGWQHCVWSSSLQQCLSPSYLPLRCMAGGCGRLLRGPESCSLGCAQATQCALCLRRPHCGWCAWGGQDGGGRCLEGGLSGPRDGEMGLRVG